MSAAEKLRALQEEDEHARDPWWGYGKGPDGFYTPSSKALTAALPQIVAVVEAAEDVDGPFAAPPSIGEQTALLHLLHAALAALDEALTVGGKK